ncbi:MAG: hypothetical protein EOO05_08940 [Chitinophagaceae bacterium]|nr:MAG: hypothetical protein EOO05_08940 [Chitinophagaceae bacterium]
MKLLLPLCLLVLALPSCKKAIEQKKENIIVSAMTSGQWKVTSFVQDGADMTSDFTGYAFKYYENRTVDAIYSGTLVTTGTWAEDVNKLAIQATFNGATDPLLLINGNWKIDKTDWTYVEATLITGSSTRKMRLEKI